MNRRLRTSPKGLFALLALALAAVLALAPADAYATNKKAKPRQQQPVSATLPEKDAALIIDGLTGNVLYSRNAHVPRYPASLTKMMTLYLLFDAMAQGKLNTSSPVTASTYAASQEPTKLGFQPGESISVEIAIKALVVRSANDVAVAVAETLGGTVSEFAEQMTRKARQLGMRDTNFYNPSGLPDKRQISTAHDLGLLARHLAYDFPQYYGYLSTNSFTYGGRLYETHNNLLAQFHGTDGIKTGYTRMSGFNLVSSVVRDNRHVIGVVLGGRTARSRDNEMSRLLALAFDRSDQNPMLLASVNVPWHTNSSPKSKPVWGAPTMMLAALEPVPSPEPVAPVAQTQFAVIEPPSTVAVPQMKMAALQSRPVAIPLPKPTLRMQIADTSETKRFDAAYEKTVRANAAELLLAAEEETSNVGIDGASSVPAQKFALANPRAKDSLASATVARTALAPLEEGDIGGPSLPAPSAAKPADIAMKKWAVQIGAFGDQIAAQAQLAKYAERAMDVVGQSKRLVTPFAAADGKKLYRARFGHFAENEAREICKRMTKRGETCFATKQVN